MYTGFDCGIVSSWDLCETHPLLLQYEHRHCAAQNTSQEHALANLARGCPAKRIKYGSPVKDTLDARVNTLILQLP